MNVTLKKRIAQATTILAWVIVVIVLIWFGKRLLKIVQFETTNDAQVNAYINPVVSRVGGYIKEINYTDFQEVKKGDTLLIIDNREYVSDAQQVQADVSKQSAAIDVLQSQENTLMVQANEAKNAIEGHKAEVWKQQLEYDRYLELYNRKSATAQQLERVKAQLDIYKSDLNQAQEHYKVALAKINDVRANEKVVAAERSRLNEVHNRKSIDVNYTVITAPYNGRLGKRSVEVGQMIKMGDHLAYIVNDETEKWVMANFKETQIADFEINDRVEVIADAFPDLIFEGKIIAFSPGTGSSFSLLAPDNATGNFVKIVQRIPVKIEITGPDSKTIKKLQPGMNVEVTVKK